MTPSLTRREARVLSIAVLAGAIAFIRRFCRFSEWRQWPDRIETDTRILDRIEDDRGNFLTVEFTLNDETPVNLTFLEYSHPERHRIGDTVRIRYPKSGPGLVQQADEPVVHPLVLMGGGGGLLLGTALVIGAWRR